MSQLFPAPNHSQLQSIGLCRLSSTEARRESLRLRQAREVCLERLTAVHEFRRALPAFGSRPQVLTKLKNHNVLVISGTTGKTTKPSLVLLTVLDQC